MNRIKEALLLIIALTMFFSFSACTTTSKNTSGQAPDTAAPQTTAPQANAASQGDRIEDATLEKVRKVKPLETTCSNIVFNRFEIPANLDKDYPDATTTCKLMMISHLRHKNAYKNVMESAAPPYPVRTVLVDGKIEDMRIASMAARVWGGAFAGESFMNVRIRLTDAASKKVIHEKVISTHNNAFAAAWSMGANDNSLPMDMGKILGEYIYTVLPAHP